MNSSPSLGSIVPSQHQSAASLTYDMMEAHQTWVDPDTDITVGAETGREPLAKTASYYKRNWTTGKPYSAMPIWGDLSHLPPSRRELIARPDLALVAMRRILTKLEGELLEEAEATERLRLKREDRLARIRQRHADRHEAQRQLGIEPINHKYAQKLEVRQRSEAAILEASQQSLPGLAAGRPAPISIAMASAASLPSHIVAPTSPGGLSTRLSRAESSPMLGMRAGQVAGLEGLLIPRFTMRSPSPTSPARDDSVANLHRSASRTPPPLSPQPRSPSPPPQLVGAPEEAAGEAYAPAAMSAAPHQLPRTATAGSSLSRAGRTPGERAAAVNAAMNRSQSMGAGLTMPAPMSGTVASAIASLAAKSPAPRHARNSAPLLGWAEPHGQSLGRPPRRSPFHFEGGLSKHHQPLQPRPAFKPAARGIHTSESQIDVNLRSGAVGDGGRAYEFTPATGSLAPMRWSPAREDPHRGRHTGVRTSSPPVSPMRDYAYPMPDSPMLGGGGESTHSLDAPALPPSPNSLSRAARALGGI